MVRDRMKKVFTSRIFFIVFSLMASVALWLYVSFMENPDTTQSVRVNVQLLHEDYLTDRGLVVTSINPEVVTLRFNGKRNIVTRLTNENVSATVDLSLIQEKSIKALNYSLITPIDISALSYTLSKSVDNITVTVDNLVTEEIPVRAQYTGGVAEDYQAEPIEVTPTVITVTGPQDIVSKISHALATLKRENITKSVEEQRPFTLIDDSGHEVVSDKLTFSQDTVNVTLQVLKKKEMPLDVSLIYGAGADQTNTSYKITPATISVSGDAEMLDEYNKITLGTGTNTIDTTKFLSTKKFEMPIVLPDGMKNLTGITQATVTVTITGLESMHVITENISVANETPGYSATIITKSLDLLLRGTADDIDKIRSKNGKTAVPVSYRVVADLSEVGDSVGTYSVLAKVYVDGNVASVGAVGEYRVTVTITKD